MGCSRLQAGASVDLTGGGSPTWAGTMTGVGQGRLELVSGRLNAQGLVLDCAPGMFHWSGGALAGTLTNLGEINVLAQNSGALSGAIYNEGVVRVNGPGNLNLNAGSSFRNQPGSELIPVRRRRRPKHLLRRPCSGKRRRHQKNRTRCFHGVYSRPQRRRRLCRGRGNAVVQRW